MLGKLNLKAAQSDAQPEEKEVCCVSLSLLPRESRQCWQCIVTWWEELGVQLFLLYHEVVVCRDNLFVSVWVDPGLSPPCQKVM